MTTTDKQEQQLQATQRTIFRVQKTRDYTVMHRHCLNNADLSWKAKGVLAYMLSMRDDWHFYEYELMRHARDQRHALRSALLELINAGYIQRSQPRSHEGTFAAIEYVVYGIPPLSGFPTADNPTSENQTAENQTLTSTHPTSTDPTNTERNAAAENKIKTEHELSYDKNEAVQPSDTYVSFWQEAYGKANERQVRVLRDIAAVHSLDDFRAACFEALQKHGRTPEYVARILERWASEGRPDGNGHGNHREVETAATPSSGRFDHLLKR